MDFGVDDDQQAMRDAVRALCADRFALDRVADREGLPVDVATWDALAQLGVLGLLDEGSGLGPVEATLAFEELGAHLVGGPVLWTVLATDLVPGAADGGVRVTGVEVAGWADGPVVVPHGGESDVLLVVHDDRVEWCLLAELDATPGASMDPLTPMVVLAATPAGELVAEGPPVGELRRTGTLLAAALLVGGAQAVLDVARGYALERQQFGVAIGSFQAVKHLLADCYVRVEMARAATYAAAALAAGRGEGDAGRAAATAKHLAGDAAVLNSRTAVQVLGGMGFTWDMLPHYFLKRAFVLDRTFGSAADHAARLGDAVGVEGDGGMSAADGPGVLIDVIDGVLRIRLDRPERKNALSVEGIALVVDALERAATDDSTRAVLVASTGPDFCAGADWVASNTAAGPRPCTGSIQRRTPLQAHRLIHLLLEVQLPVVAAVRGWAAGLGCQIAIAADVTVAADSSRFWEPFLDRGFSPDSGATWLLPRLVGVARAKEMLLLGRQLSGAEAAEWGLIHRAVPDAELDGVADELVTRLAAGPTVAIGVTKRSIHRALEGSLAEALETEANALELTSRSPDFKEGLAAFRESRAPRFQGR